MIGQSPFGTWQLTLPDTAEVRDWFTGSLITDILFDITYTARRRHGRPDPRRHRPMTGQADRPQEILSLPQGGGALSGIGEKFAPDPHTGTANLSIPLPLPAGRNGFGPKVSLAYTSGAGNGPFGLGWNLDVPAISRKTSLGVPVYDDSTDVFILAGGEDLVPVGSPAPGVTRYRPRTEGCLLLHRPPQPSRAATTGRCAAKTDSPASTARPAAPETARR